MTKGAGSACMWKRGDFFCCSKKCNFCLDFNGGFYMLLVLSRQIVNGGKVHLMQLTNLQMLLHVPLFMRLAVLIAR